MCVHVSALGLRHNQAFDNLKPRKRTESKKIMETHRMTLLCLEFKISKLERLPCVVRHFVVVSQIFESNLEKDFSHITNIFRHKGTVLHSCYISIQPLTVICYREILLQVESHQIFVLISLKILRIVHDCRPNMCYL